MRDKNKRSVPRNFAPGSLECVGVVLKACKGKKRPCKQESRHSERWKSIIEYGVDFASESTLNTSGQFNSFRMSNEAGHSTLPPLSQHASEGATM